MRQGLVGAIEHPSFRDGNDRGPSFADRTHVKDQIAQAVERDALSIALDHRACATGEAVRAGRIASGRRKARIIELFPPIERERIPASPRPVFPEAFLDHFRLAAERDLVRAHVRHHDAHEVVGTEDVREQRDQRFLDVVRAFDVHAARVEIHHEDTAAWIGRQLVRARRRSRIDTFSLCGRMHDDVLEALDRSADAVFRNLEVRCGQVLDRHAVARRIDIHAHEVRSGLEGRLLLADGEDQRAGDDERERDTEAAPGARTRGGEHVGPPRQLACRV